MKKSELEKIIREETENVISEKFEGSKYDNEESEEADLSPLSSTDHPDFGAEVEDDPVKPADWPASTPEALIKTYRASPEKWERDRLDWPLLAAGEEWSGSGRTNRMPGWTDAMHQQVIDGMTSTEELKARIKAIQVAISNRNVQESRIEGRAVCIKTTMGPKQ